MSRERSLKELIRSMRPKLHAGEFVFTSQSSLVKVPIDSIIGQFTEKEGITLIMKKNEADGLRLSYDYVASWITLTVHSSLDAVGLTAIFSSELAKHGISCNVIAAFYHDHIFVENKDGEKALAVLTELSENYE